MVVKTKKGWKRLFASAQHPRAVERAVAIEQVVREPDGEAADGGALAS
jgi:hypothetical protein